MKKVIVRGFIVVVLLIVVLVVGVYFYLNTIAKRAVEEGGTYATGVDVSLDDIELGVFSGVVEIEELTVANPAGMGFESAHFFNLGEGDVVVSVRSLFSEEVVVPRIHLDGVSLNLERQGEKDNYAVILDNLAKLSSGEKDPQAEEAQPQKWVIQDLRVTNIDVNASVKGLVADNQTVNVKIPEIALQNVQSDSLAELQGQVLKQILTAVAQQAQAQLPNLIAGELNAGIGKIGDLGQATVAKVGEVGGQVAEKIGEIAPEAGAVVGEAAKSIEGVGKEAGEAIEKAGEGLGDLLGGKKGEKKEEGRE